MIRFSLRCTHDHEFEGWFRDNAGYEAQVERNVLECPVCGDRAIEKAVMAPAVSRARDAAPADPRADQRKAAAAQMLKMMRALREHVEANFENVGDRFPEEARRMHYGEVEKQEIYGEATREEVKDLLDEGVPVRPLPMVPKLES
jgi:hypothetical protein